MKNRVFTAVLSTVFLLSFPANAEETPVYESLSEVSVGRVFFTATQRAHLDSLRGKSNVGSSSSAKSRPADRKPSNPDAAGFIVRSSGKSRVYRNGDFIEVAADPDVKFPDDVAVTRKPGAEEGAKDDEAN